MPTSNPLLRSRLLAAALAAATFAASAHAQVCDGAAAVVYNETIEVGRHVDAERYVRRAVFRNTAEGDYVLEFTVYRREHNERWTVTFERSEAFDSVRHLEIDGVWAHTVSSRTVAGKRRLLIETPGGSVEISRDDQPGDAKFDEFVALVAATAAQRAVVSEVLDDFPHWEYPPLQCVAWCFSNDQMCGYVPVCAPPNNPTACDCWEAFECCMSDYMAWHLCTVNCICSFCYDSFVDECCARMGAVQAAVQLDCERDLLKCLASPNVQPCAPVE